MHPEDISAANDPIMELAYMRATVSATARRPEFSAATHTGPHHVIDTVTGRSLESHHWPENADHAVAVLNAHETANGRPDGRYVRRDAKPRT